MPADEKVVGVLTVLMWSLGEAMSKMKEWLVELKKVLSPTTLLLLPLLHNEWVVGWRVLAEVLVLVVGRLSEYLTLVAE